jgi:hypothetical protein
MAGKNELLLVKIFGNSFLYLPGGPPAENENSPKEKRHNHKYKNLKIFEVKRMVFFYNGD